MDVEERVGVWSDGRRIGTGARWLSCGVQIRQVRGFVMLIWERRRGGAEGAARPRSVGDGVRLCRCKRKKVGNGGRLFVWRMETGDRCRS